MKKHLLGLSLLASLTMMSAPSHATFGGKSHVKEKILFFVCKLAPRNPHCGGVTTPTPSTPAVSVPEIDAANAGLALALIGGIVAIRRERRKIG